MLRASKRHLASLAGWFCFAFLLLPAIASAAESNYATRMLHQADSIKTADNAEFGRIVARLGNGATILSAEQQMYLRYLSAWQLVYHGKYQAAIPQLNAVFEESSDPTLRFRAGVTVVNALTIATHYQQGFSRLGELIELLPHVTDRDAREQGWVVAALLYNQVGQYDLASSYADKLLQQNVAGRAACQGWQLKLESLYKSGRLRTDDSQLRNGIDICDRAGETLYANYIRTFVANLEIDEGRPDIAIELLQANYDDVKRSQYRRVISEFEALIAEAYWNSKEPARAQQFALNAVGGSGPNEFTKPIVDAYRILYLIELGQGDYQSALSFHEKYARADKGYLTETSARVLAYQAVRQQVQAKKVQIDSLNKHNEVLLLEQKVSNSAARTRGLYVSLLLSVLAFIAMWLYKTKRSQLHFMKMARRDGLTGIFNRAHFADAAEAILAFCKQGDREACVVLIDLDDFKLVNDRHGHAAGDVVLKLAVQACQAHLRSIDIIGRLGGEEFGIVLPDCVPEQGRELAEQFRLAIADVSSGQTGVGFPVSASFGVTSSRWSTHNLRQLIIHADKALYVAKNKWRNRVELFDGKNEEVIEAAALQPGAFDRRRE